MLAEGFRKTRPTLATTLGLGDDQAGRDAAGLILAMFDGMLFQALLDPDSPSRARDWTRRTYECAGCCPSGSDVRTLHDATPAGQIGAAEPVTSIPPCSGMSTRRRLGRPMSSPWWMRI
jgi:hypothetical protein